jgi:murein peptide amidase A
MDLSYPCLVRRLALATGMAASLLAAGTAAAGVHRLVLGHSVDGRPIVAIELGNPLSPRKVLVVGCIHGNEPAGAAIANRLALLGPPAGVDLWIVPSFNPDGQAAGTRGNAHAVDLNRNFPWRWQHLSGVFYSGPRPLSEPESSIAYHLVHRLRPVISIWFHQHQNVVDISEGNVALERRYAGLVGLSTTSLTREPGSVVTWENHLLPHGSAFVVELPTGRLTVSTALRFARAIDTIAR